MTAAEVAALDSRLEWPETDEDREWRRAHWGEDAAAQAGLEAFAALGAPSGVIGGPAAAEGPL